MQRVKKLGFGRVFTVVVNKEVFPLGTRSRKERVCDLLWRIE